ALLDSCMQQDTVALAETSRDQLASCQQQLVGMFQAQQEHVAKSLAAHARDVAKVGERAGALAEEKRRMRAHIDDIEKTLAMAEKEIPIIDFQALEAWSRLPDARVFSVGAPELVGPVQVRAGISDWLTAAGLDNSMVRLDSSVPSTRFNIVVEGGLDVAIPRAQALARHLRNPAAPNRWRSFQCQTVGGGSVPLYVSPDKSPQQVRMEIQTSLPVSILSEGVPGQAFSAQRARGIIASQGVKLAKLEMGDRREADTTIRWNMDMVSRLAIDRDAIVERFKKAFSLEDHGRSRGLHLVAWNAKGLPHPNPPLRRRKLALLSSHMRAGAMILVQEVHRSEDALRIFCMIQPQRYLSFLAAGSSPGVGGVALLVPQLPVAPSPGAAPTLSFDIVIPGRVALLSVVDPSSQRSIELMNVHHFDFSDGDFAAVEAAWNDALAWAADDHLRRIFIGAGGFNIADRPAASQRSPVAEAQWPTRFDKASQQLSVIDRIFLGIDARAMLSVSTRLASACDAMELSELGLSGHAPLVLQIEMARRVPREEQAIPSHLFTRRGNAETTRVGFKTAARALWRQDAPLAARLIASCPDLSAHLVIDHGSVRVAGARAFAEAFGSAAAKAHAMRGLAAEAAARRSNDRDSPAWRRVVVSDSAGMTGVVAEYWGKIFERAPTVEQKLRLNQFLARFAPQLPVVELPQPSLRALGRAAARAPPSAPGPDQLPCAAWRRSPGALLHLHALMEQLFNEGVGPHDLNWSIFLCAPQGAEEEGTPDSCTRTASIVRTLSLKNADAKLIASCADRALQPAASVATEGVQKGFTAGRRFVDRVPFLDAECRREGLLPGAAQRRPMLLSFDFGQDFPSLFRDVIDIALPKYGVPLGFCSVISALHCNCLAFSSFRVSGGSAAMEPLFALWCGIVQGCSLSGTVWRLGMDAPSRALIKALGDHQKDIEFAFNLQLAIHKCALAPLWAEVAPNLINDTEEYLTEMVPSWTGFRVDPSARYLGTRIGPGISEQGIWKDAAAKWWSRAAEMSRAGMAPSLAARAYNVNALPCLSYLAQFFFIIPEIWRVEFTMLHRLLRLPPSAMRKADILSMGAWCAPPAPMGLLPHSVGAPFRAAAHAARDWAPTLHALHDAAVEGLPLASVLKGSRSPTWWATKRSIVQNYGLVMDLSGALPHPRPACDEVPAPVPTSLIEVKRQAVAMRTIRDGLYEERLDQLIGRRLRRWGSEMPADELRGRWLELRAELRAARPAWMWSRLRTVTNGLITSGRMHIIAPRPCIMRCEARDDLSHYMACPVLRGAVAAPAEASELGSGATFLGLRHLSEHR
ncbi:unnamed protein product, partial [Prorocentrum cordatum]